MGTPIVTLPEFLQSARHAGYQSLAHAVAELVDNSIQAAASSIAVRVWEGATGPEIEVQDDGIGMDAHTLSMALCFGGSSRYGDRSGMGRFGMGLPSSSLSQARRVEVFSWRQRGRARMVRFDLDELLAGREEMEPSIMVEPPLSVAEPEAHGTVVRWTRCDQLSGQRPGTLARELGRSLGRTFRRYIWDGLSLTVNGVACPPIDPLLLDVRAPASGAAPFGKPVRLPVRTALGEGVVTAVFSELPVQEWHGLSHAEKRRLGITRGGGVSVMRADREVDVGWFFMGEKRRESYDDWWRCEISFPPTLDEAFGLTYTKQQIRPTTELIEAITPYVTAVAHALNGRVRRAHQTLQVRERFSSSETKATNIEGRLRPLPAPTSTPATNALMVRLGARWPDVLLSPPTPDVRIIEEDLGPSAVYELIHLKNRLVVIWNTAHPFYQKAYAPLAASSEPGSAERRAQLELLVVAMGREEAARSLKDTDIEGFRHAWSLTLAELIKD